jgi:hypothetical protein
VALGGPPFHGEDPGCDLPAPTGTFNDKVVRWPRDVGPDRGLSVVLPLICAAGAFLCLSPVANPLDAGGCNDDFDGTGVVATFLKVIWHSISSPAKTVCSVHCTKTLMLLSGVDMSWT